MCGIFGLLELGGGPAPDEHKLHESARKLSHRGPDGHSFFRDSAAGLVHTRLALVDLDPRSNQPFWDKTGRYALVYNGEIYNYRELRAELEARGVGFRTSGDTEVLLECLLQGDIDQTLLRLEGMFAFALYDKEEKSLLLARDRVGIKPLYIYDDGSRFVFSSEIGAMKPWIPWKADPMMVTPFFFGLHGVAEGFDLYQGVQSVTPGTLIRVRAGGRAEHRRFFKLSDFWEEPLRRRLATLTPAAAVDLVEEKLVASVKMQLRADAQLGVFCSGGVDSSLIAAIAARHRSGLTLFHSNIVGKSSEYEAAKALASHLKLNLIASEVNDVNYLERIPDVIERAEYPYRHLPTSAPFMMLSETAALHGVKGLLTGEASDECFLGYAEYAPNVIKWIKEMRRNVYALIWKAVKGPSTPRTAPSGLIREFHSRFREDLEKKEIYDEIVCKSRGKVKPEELLSFYDFSQNIRALTHRNDSMGMAAGIEGRFPFLDSELIRTALNMPIEFKLRFAPETLDTNRLFMRDKWVVRQVADRYLPKKLSRRPKLPWPTTFLERMHVNPKFFSGGALGEWLKLTDREMLYLAEQVPPPIRRALMYLEGWARVCLRGETKESLLSRMKQHVRIEPEAAPPKPFSFQLPSFPPKPQLPAPRELAEAVR